MPDNVLFSVIIPTYNREKLIGETLESLTGQTFGNFEIIVVDDGSRDNTAAVLAAWTKRDSRIHYYQKENGERGAARNYGIDRATGQYITFIDSDDIAYNFALETAAAELEKHNRPDCLALGYEIRDKETMKQTLHPLVLQGVSVNEALIHGNVLSCIGVFIRKDILNEFRFEEDRRFAGSEDWLLWLRIAARYPFAYNEKISFCMYQHDSRSVMDFPEDKLVYRVEQLKAHLMADEVFMKVYGKAAVDRVYAHMLTYTSLHLAMSKKKSKALKYLYKAGSVSIPEIWTKRTLGILKTILIK